MSHVPPVSRVRPCKPFGAVPGARRVGVWLHCSDIPLVYLQYNSMQTAILARWQAW